jgi:HNH endonuclease
LCFAKHIRVYLSYAFFSYGKPSRANAEFIDDARNAVLLRSDVHKYFDDKRLAFVLKPSATSPSTTTLVVHIFIPDSTSELINLYYNRSLQQLTGISVEYLFARFAWTIFDFLKPFLQQGQKRWISLYNADTSDTCTREAAGEETR